MHTQPDIIYLLVWHLNQYKWMEVPGIGLFRAQELPAYIDHQNNTIYPPVLKAQLAESTVFNPDEMLNHMVAYTGYDKSELNRQLMALSQTLQSELHEKSESYFIPFGKLSMVDGQLHYKSNGQNLHHQFYGMAEQPLNPLPTIKQTLVPESLPSQVKPQENKTSSYLNLNYLFWLIGLLFVILMGLMYCPSKSQLDKTIPIQTATVGDTLPSMDSILMEILADTSEEGNIINDSSLGEVSVSPPSADTTKLRETELKHEEIIAPENIEALDQKIQQKTCVIIIGSFLKKYNANRLARTLQKDGYTVYRGHYKDFNRIGVRFDCFNRKLQDVLQELKSKYEPNAWILKY